MDTKSYLKKLTAVYGPSGDEGAISSLLKEELSRYGEVKIDHMYNVSCEIEGDGPHFLLDAHLDQIGMVITDIDENGFLKIAKVGGIDPRALLGHEVTVWGKETLPGVISCQPPHLLKPDSYEKSVPISDISVDIGLTKAQAEQVVSLGQRVTLKYRETDLRNDLYSASYLDDRSGVAAILLALEKLQKAGSKAKITVQFSAQEEVGTRGAGVSAFNKTIEEALVVDVSFAATPDSNPANCGKLSVGPMIGIAPVLCQDIYQGLKETAEKRNIPYQLEVMGETTGTNADVISITGSGVRTGLISIPQRYMHTPVETVSLTDIENTAKLLAEYILNKGGEK